MSSFARMSLDLNATDIQVLWDIHSAVTQSGSAKRNRADVLNRATIVFIAACWESYVEDVAVEAFDYLLDNAQSPDAFPGKVRALASRDLREAKDERLVWNLAGDGWKSVLREHRDVVVSRWLGDFNTPKAARVRELFSSLLGLGDIAESWAWGGMTSEEACAMLDRYMGIRGDIAHRTQTENPVRKTWGKEFFAHVLRLADETDQALADHVGSLTGRAPW
jgi:RiboL-PSP-HEPN